MDAREVNQSFLREKEKRNIVASAAYPSLVRFLNSHLMEERSAFEGGDATEYRRGRVSAFRDLLRTLPHTGV